MLVCVGGSCGEGLAHVCSTNKSVQIFRQAFVYKQSFVVLRFQLRAFRRCFIFGISNICLFVRFVGKSAVVVVSLDLV